MKLDKIRFAKIIGFIQRQYAISFSDDELHELDDLIDVEVPANSYQDCSKVDELLRQIINPDGFIPAIKTIRAPNGSIAMPKKWRNMVIKALEQVREN